jgi:hypothetical protein
MQSLNTNFTITEKKSLQYYTVLVPSLFDPIIENRLKSWKPSIDNLSQSKAYVTELLQLCSTCSPDIDTVSLESMQKQLFKSHILPRIKRSLQSSKWNPVTDVDYGLNLYEMILDVAKRLVPNNQKTQKSNNNDHTVFLADVEDTGKDLCTLIKDSIMFDVIYPKLHHSLSQWKPMAAHDVDGEMIRNPPHSWIIPWLLHLDYKSMLTNLLLDVKRKIRNAIIFASKMKESNQSTDWFEWSLRFMKNWVGIFDQKTLQGITSDCLTPRLGRYLNTVSMSESSPSNPDALDIVYAFYNEGILAQMECLSLIEGELLSKIASSLHDNLTSDSNQPEPTNPENISKAAQTYIAWKKRLIFSKHDKIITKDGIPPLGYILQKDANICRILYGCLLMIKAASTNDEDSLNDLEPPMEQSTNYKTVQARRAKENRLREEEETMRGKVDKVNNVASAAKSHVQVKGGATFKEVIEDFASHNGIMFYPKSGSNNTKDGKRIYMFGTSQVYLDANVVFAVDGDLWKPMSLDDLLSIG